MEESILANQGAGGEAYEPPAEAAMMMELPPGFRFHPTDEEIITSYLIQKVMNSNFAAVAIAEADLNKCEPWDLPKKAKMGEKEWYFFCQRDRKYPTGMRTNRATETGYWKATGKDKEIFKNGKNQGQLVGMKKTLVFYRGRAPKGEKTNWVMHEYRLDGNFNFPQYNNLSKAAREGWVVCRVFHKNLGIKKTVGTGIPLSPAQGSGQLLRINSTTFGDDFLDSPSSLPPLMDPTTLTTTTTTTSFNDHKLSGFGYGYRVHDNDGIQDFTGNIRAPPSDNQYGNDYLKYFQTGSSHCPVKQTNQINNIPHSAAAWSYQTSLTSSPDQIHLHQLMIPNTSYSFRPNNLDYYPRWGSEISGGLHNGQCKVEQFSSNQSMFSASQDTGLSTADMNTNNPEISSSVISKPDVVEVGSSNTLYEDHLSDNIEGLWD